jgi:hypothetical protein
MPKFAVGDRVERIGAVVPESMRIGTVTHVIANTVGLDTFYEYEVKFGSAFATFYEEELRLASDQK